MTRYVIHSWLLLLHFDYLMRWRGFEQLHAVVRAQGLATAEKPPVSADQLSSAVDIACVLYFKPVLCLQRSAALALLLRHHGWYGELVIGAQLVPFQSHAWVEINDRVINDKTQVQQMFHVLDRC